MSHYRLPSHVHICFPDDAAVLLDLVRDKYFGLDPSQVSLLRTALTKGLAPETENGILKELAAEDLLTIGTGEGREVAPTVFEHGTEVLVDIDTESRAGVDADIRFSDVVTLVASFIAARYALQVRCLNYAVQRARRRKLIANQINPAFDIEHARNVVRRFLRIRPFLYAAHDRCLLDSLTLLEFLAHYELFPTWVLGVRTAPFMAHAWVQHDRFVFNDTPARTRCYTPILAV